MRHADALIALAVALGSFLLYLRTLAPDVVDADGGEFQFAAWNFSFVHPTGYPLFLILGGLFQRLVPIGNPAYRLNLFTALTAALAVGVLYFAAKEMTRRRGAAVIAAASFAVTRSLWYDASATETYALNAFFIALLILIALRWQALPNARAFAAFCLVLGLALTHHRTVVLWLPAFTLFAAAILWQRRASHSAFGVERFRFRFLLFAFCFSLPLLLYLYVPLRAPVSPYATLSLAPGRDIRLYDNSPIGFANYVLGRTFQSEIDWDGVSVARLSAFPQRLLDQFGGVGVGLGIVGFVAMAWRREWARLVLLSTGFVVTVLFASVYHIGDIVHYYIPAWLVWAMWIGIAIDNLQLATNKYQFSVFNFQLLIAIVLLAPQIVGNLPFTDRSGETQAREQWARLLAAPIPPNAILISNDRDEMMPLWYMQYVEDTRRDVLGLFPLITPAPEHVNIARLTDSVLDANRPVFFVKPMPGIETKYRVGGLDSLWWVEGRAAERPPQNSSGVVLAERVRVFGYDVRNDADVLRVAIYWQPLAKLEHDYTTFIHLLDTHGDKVAQGNDHQVGGEFYPTSLWDIGETLRDEQAITLPPNLAPGGYRLQVGMYHLKRTFDGQPDLEMLGEPVEIGMVELQNDK